MNRWQKIAWFNLIVVIAGFVLSFVAAATLPAQQRFKPPNRLTIVIVVTLAAVAAAKLVFRKKANQVDIDERDRQISRAVATPTYIGCAVGATVAAMTCLYAVGPMGTVTPMVAPIIPLVGVGVAIVIESVATLVLYGRGGKENE